MEENVTAINETAADATPLEAVVTEKKKKKPINRQKLQDNIWGWAFCVPLIFGTVLFVYVALIMALLLSFTNYNIFSGGVWEFLGRMFSGDKTVFDMTNVGDRLGTGEVYDPFYWYKYAFTEKVWYGPGTYNIDNGIKVNAMGYTMFNTVFYLIGIPIGMVLSVFFAVCMSRDIKGGSVFRVLYYLPCVASTVAIIYTFKLMFGKTGVFNSILHTDVPWIIDETYSWPAGNTFWTQGLLSKTMIVVMSVWKGLGGTIILYVAGLSGVNASTKEAAQIDGANGWKIFWKVTMPDLYPVIFYNVVTSVIGGMQIYAEPELFFSSSTQVNLYTSGYVSLIWFYGINDPRGSYASLGAAYGMILAVIIFVLTLFQFWLDGRKKD